MEISVNPLGVTPRQSYLIRLVVTCIGVGGIALSFDWEKKFLLGYHGPWWMRLVVLLLPWLVSGLFLGVYRRLWRPDELEALINREALSIAFYGLGFVVVATNQLQAAGFIPAFFWTNDRLLLLMIGLLLAGMGWSKRRYR